MSDPVLPKIESRLTALVAEHRLPGASVGIVRDQELAWSRGFGFADIASERPADAHTLYRVASISKTFTATAIMQLRDEGRLRLDDPLVEHIPEFAKARTRSGSIDDVTLRRLLSHRSGLITEGPFSYWDTLEFPSMERILAMLDHTEVVIAPDSANKYSNLAFALLGEVVERRSGRPYGEYVRAEILDPLGMESSAFALNDALAPRLATGYDPHPYEDEPAPAGHTHTAGIAAAAGLYTTVHDLSRWIAFQFRTGDEPRGGGRVLGGRSLDEMHRPQYIDDNWTDARCLGWMGMRRGDNVYLGHGGSIHGFLTQILYNMAHRTGVIVLTNEGRNPMPNAAAIDMMDMLIEAATSTPASAPHVKPAPTPAAWKPLLGRYHFWRGGLVQIECRAGALVLAPPTPGAISLHAPAKLEGAGAPHVFRLTEGRGNGELLTFHTSPGGSITGFDIAGFRYSKLIDALNEA